jgi:hypothetical protein
LTDADPPATEYDEGHGSATLTIAADARTLYELIADLPNMGRWSPENLGGKWVGGATGAAVGARFRGNNRLGRLRWITYCTVLSAKPGEELAFQVTGPPPAIHSIWRYRFEPGPTDGTTTVTESWQFPDNRMDAVRRGAWRIFFATPDRPQMMTKSAADTLVKLAAWRSRDRVV